MALQKQPVSLNFSKGLDTKTDKYQVPVGSFLALNNSVFNTAGRLTKRNGYKNITTLPNDNQTTLTTLNDNLIATGSSLYAYSATTNQWLNKGTIQPVSLNTQALVRNSTSQSSPDMAVAASGLALLVYQDSSASYYQVSDTTTGQQILPRTQLPSTATNPRAFLLGQNFIITFIATVGGQPHLQYIAVPTSMPNVPGTAQDISAVVTSLTAGYDGVVANNSLYVAWAATSTTIQITLLTSTLVLGSSVTITSHTSTLMSVSADNSASLPVIWVTFWDSSSTNGYTSAYAADLTQVLAPTQIITATTINELTSLPLNGINTIFYENANTYGSGPNSSVKTDFITKRTVTISGTVGSSSVMLRSVGLASKPFYDVDNTTIYMIVTYGEANQPSYFLVDSLGNIYMRLAYSNGGGYEASQVLPSVSSIGETFLVPYLIKDLLATVNKGTNLPTGTPSSAIYTQTGVNLSMFSINSSGQHSSEIASALHLTGGMLWEYDAVKPVEHGFQVWPENVGVTTATTGGNVGAGTYYYQFCYEWTDNQGNLHRSSPSIPVSIVTTGSTSINTIFVPTLRLTYKITPNPVRIVGYRWSVAQQVYYQFTSITSPVINNPAVDLVTITDTLSDAAILGQTLLYTTGGVIENIAAPACIDSALFNNRLWLIDAEDQNLLWFSKQVIEDVPVEMSDLLTVYVAPTTGAQGSTGPMTALSAMDDKLIIFKKDAIYYINGTGPDNTGANSQFSDAIFITAAVGSANPNSIVLIPQGLMFQSDKGIWLLGRDLSTSYIGAPVESYNDVEIFSAQCIPGTNQARFLLAGSITLMYDFYYSQWGTFNNIYAISSTLYQGSQTYLSSFAKVYQETPGYYLDDSAPVLMSFTTSWNSLAGLQGYERFYFANFLGTYITPFKLNVQFSYDYESSATQQVIITPDNYSAPWGGESLWGGGTNWGGNSNVFSARVFPTKQKCQTFQVSVNEIYDPSFGAAAGEGLTLSGLALIVGVKRGYRTQSTAKSFG